MSRKKWIWLAPLAILAMLAFVALGGEIVRLLWNWLLPPLFGWRQIGFWQAVGMLALCRILFGGFGFHNSDGSSFRRRAAERRAAMSPEEQERLRQGVRDRCGLGPPPDESKG